MGPNVCGTGTKHCFWLVSKVRPTKIISMFPVVHPTAMRDAVFIIFLINIETVMRNLFINRTGRFTHTNNDIVLEVISFLIFISQKKTQIFDLKNIYTTDVFSVFRSKNYFVAYFSALS